MKGSKKLKSHDIRIVPHVGKSNSKTLLNRATFTIADGLVIGITKCVRTPTWLPDAAWLDSFDTLMGGAWLGNGDGGGDDLLIRAAFPEEGFGFLKIRIEVGDHLD
ncbi:hypothetical protein D3C71_1765950 [compost metagenome]